MQPAGGGRPPFRKGREPSQCFNLVIWQRCINSKSPEEQVRTKFANTAQFCFLFFCKLPKLETVIVFSSRADSRQTQEEFLRCSHSFFLITVWSLKAAAACVPAPLPTHPSSLRDWWRHLFRRCVDGGHSCSSAFQSSVDNPAFFALQTLDIFGAVGFGERQTGMRGFLLSFFFRFRFSEGCVHVRVCQWGCFSDDGGFR